MDSKKVEIVPGLIFAVLRSEPSPRKKKNTDHFHTSDLFETLYVPFCNDFGPPCTATIFHFSRTLTAKMENKTSSQKVCFYTLSSDLANVTNGILLMGAYCILTLKWTAAATMEKFSSFQDCLLHYRDAAEGDPTYGLEMKWCFTALEKASALGWIDWNNFDYDEYTYYEQVENGDFNWIIPGKLLAFCSPTTVPINNGVTITHSPDYYVPYFQEHGITAVVRLNSDLYKAEEFTVHGIAHHELQFPDGTTPTLEIVESFLKIAENTNAVAVHCKQGLGRTGTLNGCYIMKHYDFNAAECIAFQRIQRPGSVVGPQQHFLHKIEPKVKAAKLGQPFSPTKKNGTPIKPSPKNCNKAARKEKPSIIPLKTNKTPIKQTA